jgi:hypothetical protein
MEGERREEKSLWETSTEKNPSLCFLRFSPKSIRKELQRAPGGRVKGRRGAGAMVLGEHRHGKSRVRIARAWRMRRDGRGDGDPDRDVFVEWGISVLLSSRCDASFTLADNSDIVATDSIKNTVNLHLDSLVFSFL